MLNTQRACVLDVFTTSTLRQDEILAFTAAMMTATMTMTMTTTTLATMTMTMTTTTLATKPVNQKVFFRRS